jgi:hypothetical protein
MLFLQFTEHGGQHFRGFQNLAGGVHCSIDSRRARCNNAAYTPFPALALNSFACFLADRSSNPGSERNSNMIDSPFLPPCQSSEAIFFHRHHSTSCFDGLFMMKPLFLLDTSAGPAPNDWHGWELRQT